MGIQPPVAASMLAKSRHTYMCALADFFHSSLSTSFPVVVLAICFVYISTFYLFGVTWWAELQ